MSSTRSCEMCQEPAEFYLYAAYDAGPGSTHPLVHRYPAAMFGACSQHVADLLRRDEQGTPRWVVARKPLSWTGEAEHG